MLKYFSRIDLADRWGVTPNCVWNWTKRDKDFPEPVAIVQKGRVHIYQLIDIKNYETMKGIVPYAHKQTV